jgi:hypothetical protein
MNVTTISKVRPEPTAQARGPLVSQVLVRPCFYSVTTK